MNIDWLCVSEGELNHVALLQLLPRLAKFLDKVAVAMGLRILCQERTVWAAYNSRISSGDSTIHYLREKNSEKAYLEWFWGKVVLLVLRVEFVVD